MFYKDFSAHMESSRRGNEINPLRWIAPPAGLYGPAKGAILLATRREPVSCESWLVTQAESAKGYGFHRHTSISVMPLTSAPLELVSSIMGMLA